MRGGPGLEAREKLCSSCMFMSSIGIGVCMFWPPRLQSVRADRLHDQPPIHDAAAERAHYPVWLYYFPEATTDVFITFTFCAQRLDFAFVWLSTDDNSWSKTSGSGAQIELRMPYKKTICSRFTYLCGWRYAVMLHGFTLTWYDKKSNKKIFLISAFGSFADGAYKRFGFMHTNTRAHSANTISTAYDTTYLVLCKLEDMFYLCYSLCFHSTNR